MSLFGKIIGTTMALLFISVGSMLYWKNLRMENNGIRVVGKVISHEIDTNENGIIYYPIVEFKFENGSTHFDTVKIGTNPKVYEMGDPIHLIYEKDNLENLIIDSYFWIHVFPSIFIFIGGIILYIFYRKPINN